MFMSEVLKEHIVLLIKYNVLCYQYRGNRKGNLKI